MLKKKYKVYWSLFNLFNPIQKEVVALQNWFASLFVGLGINSLITESYLLVGIIALVALIIDKLILSCLYIEEIKKGE